MKNLHLLPTEKAKTMFDSLQEYLKNTPKEKVLEDWNEFQHLDEEGITVKEFLENQKQETLEEAAKDFIENTMKFSFTSIDTRTQANRMFKCVEFGAKWQQERMYSEEEVRKAIDYGAELGLKGDIGNSFQWKDKQNKWFEQFKKK